MNQLLMVKLSCQPDCSSKLKYVPLAVLFSGTLGLLELVLEVGLSAVRETSRLENDQFQ